MLTLLLLLGGPLLLAGALAAYVTWRDRRRRPRHGQFREDGEGKSAAYQADIHRLGGGGTG